MTNLIVGVDEVGRGAFAGPLVAAAVASFDKNPKSRGALIRDSKKMTLRQREKSDKWIRKNFVYSVGVVSVGEINKHGITWANQTAFGRALEVFDRKSFVYSDVFEVRDWPKSRQKAVIKGDDSVFLISAASIVAKVYRDIYMGDISKLFQRYFWSRNKGYGTKQHRDAILEYGPCEHHRKKFVNTFLTKV